MPGKKSDEPANENTTAAGDDAASGSEPTTPPVKRQPRNVDRKRLNEERMQAASTDVEDKPFDPANLPSPGFAPEEAIFSTPARTVRDPRATDDAGVVWLRILEGLRLKGYQPEHVKIDIERTGTGAYVTDPQKCRPIDGGSVTGSDTISAADDLINAILETCHAGTQGPARYKCWFRYKRGGDITTGQVSFDSYEKVVEQQQRALDYMRRRELEAGRPARLSAGMGAPAGAPPPALGYAGYPQGYPQGFPAYAPPQPQGGAENEAMRREIAATMGAMQEQNRMLREQLEKLGATPPPPVPVIVAPPAPAAPSVDPGEAFMGQMERMLGFMKRLGVVGVGAPPAVLAAAPATPAPAAKPEKPERQEDAVRDFLKRKRQLDQDREDLAEAFGIDLEPPPAREETAVEVVAEPDKQPFKVFDIPVPGQKPLRYVHDADGLLEWAKAMIALNPEHAGKMVEIAQRTLEKGLLGRLVDAIGQQQHAAGAIPAPAEVVSNAPVGQPPPNGGGSGGWRPSA